MLFYYNNNDNDNFVLAGRKLLFHHKFIHSFIHSDMNPIRKIVFFFVVVSFSSFITQISLNGGKKTNSN